MQDENSALYQATSNGSYAVIVTEGLCTDTSNCFHSNSWCFNNDKIILGVQPNPTTGQLYLSGLNDNLVMDKIELRNSIGELIKELDMNDFKIDISHYSNVLYYLHLFLNGDK